MANVTAAIGPLPAWIPDELIEMERTSELGMKRKTAEPPAALI